MPVGIPAPSEVLEASYTRNMTRQLPSVIPVWVAAVIGAIVVGAVVPRDGYYQWIAIVLAAVVILTFCIQLGVGRTEGFVSRAMASIGVSVLVLAAASGIVALVG